MKVNQIWFLRSLQDRLKTVTGNDRSLLLEVAILTTAAPFLLAPGMGGGRFALPAALCLLTSTGVRAFRSLMRGSGAQALLVPSLLLGVMALISLPVSIDPEATHRKLYGLLLGVALYSTVVRAVTTPRALIIAWRLYALAGLGIALVGIVGTDWASTKIALISHLFELLTAANRPLRGVSRLMVDINPNEVGGVLVLMWPPIVVLAAQSWSTRRSARFSSGARLCVDVFVAGLVGAVLVLTLSRSALGGAVVALAVLIVAGRRSAARSLRFGPVIGALVGAVAAAASSAAFWVYQADAFPIAAPAADWLAHLSVRAELWQRALFIVQDFPLTGVGLNTFPRVVELLYPLVLSSGDPRPPPHAHNFLLQVAIDFGIPGLAAWLWLLVVAGRMLFHAWRSSTSAARLLAIGVTAGLSGHLIYGLADAVALGARPGFTLWWTLGLAEAAWHVIDTNAVAAADTNADREALDMRTEGDRWMAWPPPSVDRQSVGR